MRDALQHGAVDLVFRDGPAEIGDLHNLVLPLTPSRSMKGPRATAY